jgi:hypothetical protein
MAKILMADGSEIRGKIGGKVYSRNASGAFVRKYVKPTNANTGKQQSVRNSFGSLSSAYRTLSDANRATYESMRQFYKRQDSIGNTVTPTASQLFNRLNGVLLQNGIINTTSLMTTCPAPVPLIGITAAAPTSDVSAAEMYADVTFDDNTSEVPAGQRLVISATPAISAGIKSIPANVFKRIATLLPANDTATQDILTEYNAVFSAPAAGDSIYLKFQTFSVTTGQITSEFVAPVVVVP